MPVVAARDMLTLYLAPAWRYSITTHVVVPWKLGTLITIHYSTSTRTSHDGLHSPDSSLHRVPLTVQERIIFSEKVPRGSSVFISQAASVLEP